MQAVAAPASQPTTYGVVRRPPFQVPPAASFGRILSQADPFPRIARGGGLTYGAGVGMPNRIPRGGSSLGIDSAELRYEPVIQAAAARHGLSAALLRAVVRVESAFNPLAVSSVGAGGLMQLMPATAAALGVRQVFDPVENVDAGARYLRQQIDAFGSVPLALAAYHAGPTAVREHGGVPPFATTQRYVQRVMRLAGLGDAA